MRKLVFAFVAAVTLALSAPQPVQADPPLAFIMWCRTGAGGVVGLIFVGPQEFPGAVSFCRDFFDGHPEGVELLR